MDFDVKRAAKLFDAMSEDNRITILALLVDGEKCASNLLDDLKISQPTLSHHMKILCGAKIVTARKDGKRVLYSVAPEYKDMLNYNLKFCKQLKSRE